MHQGTDIVVLIIVFRSVSNLLLFFGTDDFEKAQYSLCSCGKLTTMFSIVFYFKMSMFSNENLQSKSLLWARVVIQTINKVGDWCWRRKHIKLNTAMTRGTAPLILTIFCSRGCVSVFSDMHADTEIHQTTHGAGLKELLDSGGQGFHLSNGPAEEPRGEICLTQVLVTSVRGSTRSPE